MLPKEPEKYQPYDHHHQLAYAIKSALYSGRDSGPSVRIEVPFDKLIFQGGLMRAGKLLKTVRGEEHFGISNYEDLVPFLGQRWYIRGINDHLDFCAVCLDTVVFHLHKKAAIIDYLSPKVDPTNGGYTLIFKFVRFDGVKEQLPNFCIDINFSN